MDKYMVEFCKTFDFDIEYLDYNDISKLEKSLMFQRFKLSKLIKEIVLEVSKDIVIIPYKIKNILKKFKKKSEQQKPFGDEELMSLIEKLGTDVVVYGNKEAIDRIEKNKNNIK